MRTRILLPALGGVAVAAAMALAATVPAAADSTPSPSASPTSGAAPSTPHTRCTGSSQAVLTCIKQRSQVAISDRESALQTMANDLNSRKHVTASDRSALLGQVSSDESGLQTLETEIEGSTSVQQAHTLAETIVTGYRVYVLEGPKVHIAIAGDTENAVEATIQNLLPSVQTTINDSSVSQQEKQAAQEALDDCTAQLALAEKASAGASAAVIDLQPSGYPGNKPALVAGRDSVHTARTHLRSCRTDLRNIRTDLGL